MGEEGNRTVSIHRRAARRDDNEQTIVDALEAAGASVLTISKKDACDLLIGYRGVNYLQEVKQGTDGKTRRTTRGDRTDADGRSKGQVEFAANWRGAPPVIVRTPAEALAAIGAAS